MGWQTGAPKRSGKALAGFILGLLSILLFITIAVPLLGLIFGLLGAREIKRSAGARSGLGMARAGWILGLLGLIGGAFLWVAIGVFISETESVFSLKVGQCVELPDEDESEVSRVRTFDCSEAHEAEVFAVGDLGSGNEPYPGASTLDEMIAEECIPAFEDYVGVPYLESQYEVYRIYPTEDVWETDQGFVCLAFDPDGELTESIEGSER
jgi:Septum formation